MVISVVIRAARRVLEAGEAVMLVGHAGVGKTSIIKQIAKETGRDLKILILSQMEPGDLIGLPDKRGKQTKFLQPDWWPKSGKSIIFLDEINRAHPLVRNAVMQLVLDRRIHNHILPEGTWIAAAMNPSDGYEVFEIEDPAFIDRFVWINVENSTENFISYLKEKGLYAPGIEDVIEGNLQIETRFKLPKIVPTPRAWERAIRISRALSKEDLEEFGLELLCGILGEEGKDLWEFLINVQSEEANMTVEEILALPPKKRTRLLPKLAGLVNTDPEKFFLLLEKLPPEEAASLLRRASNFSKDKLIEGFRHRKEVLKRILRDQIRRRVV